MYNNPYMYARISPYFGMTPPISRSIFPKITNAFSQLKNINWGGMINNASKTINVINQTIPIVKQAGPMVKNMKSVLKVASIFKDETDPPKPKNNNITKNNNAIKKEATINNDYISPINNNNSPTFFIN